MTEQTCKIKWGENVIIADAEYIDSVAFNLIVNFERMIGRHIPQADMAQWVECIAADGGCQHLNNEERAEQHTTHVILIHNKEKEGIDNFNPSAFYAKDEEDRAWLDGQAFMGNIGECIFHCVAAEGKETMTKSDIMADIMAHLADEDSVRRIMIVPDMETGETMQYLMPVMKHIDRNHSEKRITVFSMQPLSGLPCRTEILGYSIMAALGIRASELEKL